MSRFATLFVLIAAPPSVAPAQDAKDAPIVLLANPLGVQPGATAKVLLRGLRLDGATGVKASDAGVGVKIVGQGNAAVPNTLKAEKVGDRQVEVEVTVPAETPAGEASLVV